MIPSAQELLRQAKPKLAETESTAPPKHPNFPGLIGKIATGSEHFGMVLPKDVNGKVNPRVYPEYRANGTTFYHMDVRGPVVGVHPSGSTVNVYIHDLTDGKIYSCDIGHIKVEHADPSDDADFRERHAAGDPTAIAQAEQ